MSANNLLKIYSKLIKGKKKWVVEHHDFECGNLGDKFKKCDTLEKAVEEANAFMQENEVEYGLSISPE
ncbi:MAG: hypothetical protein A2908_00225 [Candidatus Staskawiczbacteria bacterium RIFCSPLOWO2_01_FULL_38_12b]|uniref:Uncharacterized protein n=1 Tax=Candidatus Staskawiczbacteria bacterium RIFCSPLOWO2_01_FULL_38_12b TaxID=1802214 RepID=A0A1G2IDK0_9BACT|nr:MAG: hypothetical protein A2908_00225 [Candidatus Staskawiczbacteria bacterium RIFCSPLOWO2_01_FULL_38_12b]